MPRCTVNISLPHDGEDVTTILDVDFEVAPPDPDVGILDCGIDSFTAKVIDVDIEPVTPELLASFQAYFDAHEEDFRDEVDDACLESL
jgi:hypothetical protein